MIAKFRSLDVLAVKDSSQAISREHLKKLHRHRSFASRATGLIVLGFSLVPGAIFWQMLNAPIHASEFPLEVKLGFVAFTGLCFAFGVWLGVLLLRWPLVDPVRRFLKKPSDFELCSGHLISGSITNMDSRRRSRTWTAEIEFGSKAGKRKVFENFSRSIVSDRYGKRDEVTKGLESLLPVEAWVLQGLLGRRQVKPIGKFSVFKIFLDDVSWVIHTLIHGTDDALIGLDSDVIQKIPKKMRSTREDNHVLHFSILAFALTVFFFWHPGIPDGAWLEVKKNIPRLDERRRSCEASRRELQNVESQKAGMVLRGQVLAEEWYKELQYAAEGRAHV